MTFPIVGLLIACAGEGTRGVKCVDKKTKQKTFIVLGRGMTQSCSFCKDISGANTGFTATFE